MNKNSRVTKHFSSRPGGERPLINVNLPRPLHKRIADEAKRKNLSIYAYIAHLQDFYEFQYFDEIIGRIREEYNKGLTPVMFAYLSVLFSLLQHIHNNLDLS